jgi:hypothetical protein
VSAASSSSGKMPEPEICVLGSGWMGRSAIKLHY